VARTELGRAPPRRMATRHAEGGSEAPTGNGPGGRGTTAALGPSTPVRATRPRATAAAATARRPRRVPSERSAVDTVWVTFRCGDSTGGVEREWKKSAAPRRATADLFKSFNL